MRKNRLAIALLVLALAASASLWAGNKKKSKLKNAPSAAAQMEERQRALHVLNRFTFGPHPGDVDRVAAMGVEQWFEQQLYPEKIDDAALQARLAPLRTLNMDARALITNFPPPQLIKQVADGRMALPSNPAERAIYEAQLERYRQRQESKSAQANAADTQDMNAISDEQRREARLRARDDAQRILDLPPEQRYQAVLAMSPEERQQFARVISAADREAIAGSLTPQQREQIMAMNNPQQVVVTELMQGKLLRDAYSERQLQEVMADFWFNHFNVFIGKGPDRYLISEYENKVIRPLALGKFKDLLLATAQSPAMLFYLDNWQSVGPDSPVGLGGPLREPRAATRPMRPYGGVFARRFPGAGMPQPRPPRPQSPNAQQQRRGLNENYARELMELHTLGVDGGYTQKDVTELARVLTGWTIQQPRQGGEFAFNERMHEPGTKVVLGHTIKENGEKEGLEMLDILDILAHHPSTARFISRKLAMRFVSDDPPPALVDRMAKTFLKSDGDIREVLRTMFRSPEFWTPQNYRAKVKTPLEFVVSAIRASGADVRNALPLVQTLNQMGMPLYGAQPPTGYSMKAETWVNSGALLNRMNFALRFTSGRMPGVQFAPDRVLGSPQPPADGRQALAQLESALLAGEVSRQTHETILKQLSDPQVTGRVLDDAARPPNVGVIAGLILGSPEFQRR
jgi:uncharacterized protein (DUF1800 family)